MKEILKRSGCQSLNPMQQKVVDGGLLTTNKSIIVSAPTNSGKTLVAELAALKSLDDGYSVIYTCPMKSLAEEKYDDFREHFSTSRVEISTGDYSSTKSRLERLERADIIICTYEMLDSHSYKNSKWVENAGLLIVDETDMISSEGRGDRLETAIMQFTSINPGARLVFISATMGRLDNLVNWIENMKGETPIVVKSNYRPIPLDVSYRKVHYRDSVVNAAAMTVINDISRGRDDKYLIFLGSRWATQHCAKILREAGVNAKFHNASLSLSNRRSIENEFNYGDLRVICATPTLSRGVNVNADTVIVAGTSRGINPIPAIEIHQSIGRAGRSKFMSGPKARGRAIVLVQSHIYDKEVKRIKNIKVESVLCRETGSNLMFHIIKCIYSGIANTLQGLMDWYTRSLAYVTYSRSRYYVAVDDIMARDVSELIDMNIIKYDKGDKLAVTPLGYICAVMYVHPIDVINWYLGFSKIIKDNHWDNDLVVSWVLVASTDVRSGYVTDDESKWIRKFVKSSGLKRKYISRGIRLKYAILNYYCLNEQKIPIEELDGKMAYIRTLRASIERRIQTIKLIGVKKHWPKYVNDELDILLIRFKYGIDRKHCELARIPNIGPSRVMSLYNNGICSISDLIDPNNYKIIVNTIGKRVTDKVISYVKNNRIPSPKGKIGLRK